MVASTPIKIVSTRKPPRKIAILPIRPPTVLRCGASAVATADRADIVRLRLYALQMQKALENTDQMKIGHEKGSGNLQHL
jgi:hypothetical protein